MFLSNQLTAQDQILSQKWKSIAKEIGIEVEAPFTLKKGDATFIYAAMIKNFGSEGCEKGFVVRAAPEIFTVEQCGEIWDVAIENGYMAINVSEFGINILGAEYAINSELANLCWCGSAEKRPIWHRDPQNEK